ncbi:TolC family protein [Robbsia sp. KACC 23696]|uniref:TolC family protein n=1 Tax=Robbsia sp. KACC 23696 TaxID=3149231 RepID=UPI00325ADB64
MVERRGHVFQPFVPSRTKGLEGKKRRALRAATLIIGLIGVQASVVTAAPGAAVSALTEPRARVAAFESPTVLGGTIVPPETLAQPSDMLCDAPTPGESWQRDVGDTRLDAVIAIALRDNVALKESSARLGQAEARRRAEGAARGPQADADVRYDRRDPLASGEDPWRNNRSEFRTAFTVTQDLDLWGRLRDRQRGARLQEAQARFERDDTRRQLILAVVKAYWEQAYLNEKAVWLRALQDIARQRVMIMTARYDNGDVAMDDLATARADAHQRDIEWAQLEARVSKSGYTLARLMGQAPGVTDSIAIVSKRPSGLLARMADRARTLPAMIGFHDDARLPSALPDIPAGLSAAQLQCRPDIRASAAALSAFAAEAAVVRKDWYPRLSLTAGLNASSPSLLSLVNAPMAVLAGMVKLPFLNPGQRHRITEAEARYEAAETRYLQQWQTSLRDVADALAEANRALIARTNEESRQVDLNKAERLAEHRYRAGEIAAADWLDRREQRIRVEMALLAERRDEAVSVVQVVQALGDGTRMAALTR